MKAVEARRRLGDSSAERLALVAPSLQDKSTLRPSKDRPMRCRFVVLTLTAFLAFPHALDSQAAPGPAAGVISIGSRDSVWSPTLREWRRYQVYLPPGYTGAAMLPRAYPVVYVLDGGVHFHSLTGVIQFFSTGGNGNFVLPEMIVIGIANTDRTRDLTPTHATTGPDGKPAPFATSGGGTAFLQFVRSELMPRIDSAYRTEPYRVLVGHSFGGIIAIHALYTMPDAFNAYVAIDPSLWWDSRRMVEQARSYFASAKLTGRTLYVAQANTVDLTRNSAEGPCGTPSKRAECPDTGSLAHFRAIGDFDRVMRAANMSGLRYAYRYYPNDDHGSVPLIAGYDALRLIFDGYRFDFTKRITVDAIRSHFENVSRRAGYTVKPPEKMLGLVSTAWANSDSAMTVSVARYYAELYPTSPQALEALGYALLTTRDTTGAVSAYRQASALAPQNQRIKDLLAKLRP